MCSCNVAILVKDEFQDRDCKIDELVITFSSGTNEIDNFYEVELFVHVFNETKFYNFIISMYEDNFKIFFIIITFQFIQVLMTFRKSLFYLCQMLSTSQSHMLNIHIPVVFC